MALSQSVPSDLIPRPWGGWERDAQIDRQQYLSALGYEWTPEEARDQMARFGETAREWARENAAVLTYRAIDLGLPVTARSEIRQAILDSLEG